MIPKRSGVSNQTDRFMGQRHANDIAADHATELFVRRTLCAHQLHSSGHSSSERDNTSGPPIEELLPPLTSSNEVDLQLYAFIAIVIKELVLPWYSKITPDHVFVDEVIQVIAHCTRALEQRARKVNLESLLLDELPALLDAHVSAYRIAHNVENPLTSPRQIYHNLRPHPALAPPPDALDPGKELEQQQNDGAYRQLVAQGILAVLLPTEDLQNACLRSLVGEVLSEFILGNVICGRISDAEFIWDGIRKASETLQPYVGRQTWAIDPSAHDEARWGQVPVKASGDSSRARGSRGLTRLSLLFWHVLQITLTGLSALRVMIMALVAASSLPTRARVNFVPTQQRSYKPQGGPSSQTVTDQQESGSMTAIVSLRIWTTIEHLVSVSQRMPWLCGAIALGQHLATCGPLRVCGTDGRVDRLLAHLIRTRLLTPAHLPTLLRELRLSLFPGNALPAAALQPPQPPPPTPAAAASTPPPPSSQRRRQQQQQPSSPTRLAAAHHLLNLAPQRLAAVFFATSDREVMARAIDADVLAPFEDPYMNRHLAYAILEAVLAALLPELALPEGRGVGELLAERGVS